MTFTDRFLWTAPIPAAVQAALAIRWPQLAHRSALDSSVVAQLWAAGPGSGAAVALVDRELPAAFCHTVLAKERRQGVLATLARRNWDRLTEADRDTLIGRVRGDAAATVLKHVGPEYHRRVFARLDAPDRLHWLAAQAPAELDDAALCALLADIGEWGAGRWPRHGRSTSTRALEVLAHFRPVVLGPLATTGPGEALGAIAGALTLDDPALQAVLAERITTENLPYVGMALAANPVASAETLTTLGRFAARERHGTLTELIERTLRYRTDGRPHFQGPVLTETDPVAVRAAVRRTQPSAWKAQGRPVQAAYLMAAAGLGPEAVRDLLEEARAVVSIVPSWVALASLDALETRAAALGCTDAGTTVLFTNLRRWAGPSDGCHATPEPGAVRDTMRGTWTVTTAATLASSCRSNDELAAALAGIDTVLGEEPATWELLLGMLDGYPGTLGELANLARASTA